MIYMDTDGGSRPVGRARLAARLIQLRPAAAAATNNNNNNNWQFRAPN